MPGIDSPAATKRFLEQDVPGPLGAAITLYVCALDTQGTSPNTQYAYKKELVSLIERWPDLGLAEFGYDELQLWLHRRTAGLSDAVTRKAITAVSGFFDFCVRSGRIETNPCTLLKAPPKRRREPSYWTTEQMRLVINATETPRDRLLLSTLAFTGQRLEVVRTLTWERVRCFDRADRDEAHIRFPRGKNGTYHSLPIHDELVRQFHALRLGVEPEPTDPVFRSIRLTPEGKPRPVAANRVWNIIQKACRKAGVRCAGAHEFRRSLATELLNDPSVPFIAVSKGILNHKNPETTMSCYAGAHADQVGRALRGVRI